METAAVFMSVLGLVAQPVRYGFWRWVRYIFAWIWYGLLWLFLGRIFFWTDYEPRVPSIDDDGKHEIWD